MATIKTSNRYTGRVTEWDVIKQTKTTITVLRPDWATRQMILRLQPSSGLYVNHHAGEVCKL